MIQNREYWIDPLFVIRSSNININYTNYPSYYYSFL